MRILLLAAVLAVPLASAGLVVTSPSDGAVVDADIVVEGRYEDSPEARLATTPGFLGRMGDVLLFEQEAPSWAGTLGLPVVEHVPLERPIIQYADVRDVALPPGQAQGIQPGSHILMDRPDGTFGCTANFIWRDHANQRLYLGAAGHCFLPEDKTSTHGPGKDYDPSKTSVRVCVSGCQYGGQAGFIFTGTLQDLGPVAYARQTGSGGDVGNDFGLVEIPESLWDLVEPAMAVWGGPTGSERLGLGDTTVHFGNAAGLGEHYTTQARAGAGGGSDSDSWIATAPSMQGDSGAALNIGRTDGADLVGDAAAGVLTHLSAGIQLGFVAGTTMERSIAMAREADLEIELALEGSEIPGFASAVPPTPVDVQAVPGDGQVRVSWQPGDGPEATDFVVRYGEVPGGPYSEETATAGTDVLVTGLANDATYYFVVHARSDAGESAASPEVAAVPTAGAAAPGAPRGLAALAGESAVDLTWDPPADDGGAAVTGYTVKWRTGGDAGFKHSKQVAATSATVDGLAGGREYTFVVHARNDVGEGPASNQAKATPFAAAEPVRVVEVRLDGGAWQRAQTWDGEAFRHVMEGVPAGSHTLEVQLVQDGESMGAESRRIEVRPEQVEDAPQGQDSPWIPVGLVVVALAAVAARRR